MVVCDDDPSEDERIRESPILLIEVLSKATRKQDKGEVQRRSNSWQSDYYFLGDEVWLESVNASLSVAAMYERVHNEDMLSWLEEQRNKDKA